MDTWVETGVTVTPFYDSLLAKVMVHGTSRAEAISKAQAALADTRLAGIASNLEFNCAVLASAAFAAGVCASPPLSLPYCTQRSEGLHCSAELPCGQLDRPVAKS